MNALIVSLLKPLVGWIPPGWMTGVGLLGLAAIQIAYQLSWIDKETGSALEQVCIAVSGVGVLRHQVNVASKVK